jgi:hypothetical protein
MVFEIPLPFDCSSRQSGPRSAAATAQRSPLIPARSLSHDGMGHCAIAAVVLPKTCSVGAMC